MATNAELIIAIGELSDVPTEGLTNVKLCELLKDLKAKKTDEETVTRADEVEADEHITTSVITCKRGMLRIGEVIKPEYLSGGQESFDKLIKAGHIV